MKKLICAVLLLLLFGCARVQVSQDYDAAVDFSQYQTYNWRETTRSGSEDVRENSPLMHQRIKKTISSVLQEMGFSQEIRGDFSISYDYSVVTKIESYPFHTYYGVGFGSRHRYDGFGIVTGAELYQYDVGVITIDIYDNSTNQAVWRGTGSETVHTHSTPEKSDEKIERMIRSILLQFPPVS